MNHVARVHVSMELLVDVLKFPSDTKILGAGVVKDGVVELIVEHPDLLAVSDLDELPLVTPKYSLTWVKFQWY